MFLLVITFKKSEELSPGGARLGCIDILFLFYMHLGAAYLLISFAQKSLALLLLLGSGIFCAESFSGLIWFIWRSEYMSRQHAHRSGKCGGLTQLLTRLAR